MKNKKQTVGIERPIMTLWSRTSWFICWHVAQLALAYAAFFSVANVRLVFRALDIVTNENVWLSLDLIAVQLLIESVIILILFFAVIRTSFLMVGVLINLRRIRSTEDLLTSGGNSFGFEGAQGVGKTRTMVYASMLLAEDRAEDLCLKYYKALPVREQLASSSRFWELRRFNSREEAYHFYFRDNKDKIACLYGNVDLNYDGLRPFKLVAKHFTQQERLYENNVKILTEADDLFPNTLRKKKKKNEEKDKDELDVNAIDKFVGLDRQFTNGTLISDTHANSDVFKSIRNCQAFTLYLTRSEFRYTPRILKRIYRKINGRILSAGDKFKELEFADKKPKKQRRLLKKLNRLQKLSKRVERLMRNIAITRVYYYKISGTADQKTVGEEEFFVLPNQVPYVYDDRMFQSEYAFSKKLEDTAEAVTRREAIKQPTAKP